MNEEQLARLLQSADPGAPIVYPELLRRRYLIMARAVIEAYGRKDHGS